MSRQPEAIESASADEVAEVALDRLTKSVRHTHERVAPYRKACEAAGVHPDGLRSLDDLAGFPFTTKADLRADQPFGRFAVPREELARIHASSGTTGLATVVGYTAADLDMWAGLMARGMRAAGARPGMTVHIAYGYGLFTGGLGAHAGAEALGCAVVPASSGQTERQIKLIQDLRPEVIMVTPSYLLAMADEMDRLGVDPASTSLRVGILGAEPWTQAMRTEIETRFGMDAVDIYGLSEVLGPGVAIECVDTKDGLHIWEDHFRPEIIEPATGEVLPDGTAGELVLTSLTKQAFPVIRYRTGDLTRLLPGTARPGHRRIERITGRADDMMIIRGANVYPSQIEQVVLKVGLAPHFVCVLRRPVRLDELTVRAECRAGVDAAERERLAQLLSAGLLEELGLRADIEIVESGTLERSVGKAKRVLDERGLS
ncbi:MAG TPA: AMP-binding protein [Sporichthyaceae bacterium]|jgi:phenylacetate-CoA ligase